MDDAAYAFDFSQHRWSVRLHFLSGITTPALLTLLWRYRRHISVTHAHRVLFMLLISLFNSACAALETLLYARRIRATQLDTSPLIVLGHPRTGTTHLHNLLSQDGRYAVCTTWMCAFPSSFLVLRPFKRLLAGMLTPTRPMDCMALSWDLPAEDEIASCVLSGGVSPYMALVFPNASFQDFYSFSSASAADYAVWEAAFLGFCLKTTFACGGNRPLLLKSPVHTARIRVLSRLFPEARFVCAHRHPLRVFSSAAHMAQSYYTYTLLETPSDERMTRYILDLFVTLFDEYEAQRKRVPPGRLVEVPFALLDDDPMGALRIVYDTLRLGRFDAECGAGAAARSYARSLRGFKQNDLRPLGPAVEARVRARWAAAFGGRWGYA